MVPVKKKSIFKSRRPDEVGNAKRLALYKHNWNAQAEARPEVAVDVSRAFPDVDAEFSATALTRVPADPRPGSPAEDVAKVKCDKKDKGVCYFYTNAFQYCYWCSSGHEPAQVSSNLLMLSTLFPVLHGNSQRKKSAPNPGVRGIPGAER